MTLDEITLADFAPCVGQKFSVTLPDPAPQAPPLVFELSEARPSARPARPGKRQSFSLRFRTPPGWECRQGTYALGHPTLGELAIFLVPVGRDATGMELEAVFNFA
jgi:hypothetical protein